MAPTTITATCTCAHARELVTDLFGETRARPTRCRAWGCRCLWFLLEGAL